MFANDRKSFNNFDLIIRDKFENKSNIKSNLSKSVNLKVSSSFINASSRQKLYEVLFLKYKKLYNFNDFNDEIDKELIEFFKKDIIVECDLKNLDNNIKNLAQKYIEKNNQEKDENKINSNDPKKPLPYIISKSISYIDTKSNRGNTQTKQSKQSTKMSGASSLSMIFGNNPQNKREKDYVSILLEKSKQQSNTKPKNLPYNIDDWNSVIKYNKNQFEEEKRIKFIKNKQIQQLTKNELDQQLKDLNRTRKLKFEEDKNYNDCVINNINLRADEEKEKMQSKKNKLKKDKELTDNLYSIERERKKSEELYQRKLDKESKFFLKIDIMQRDYFEEENNNNKRHKQIQKDFFESAIKGDNLTKSIKDKIKNEELVNDLKNLEDSAKICDLYDNYRKKDREKAFKLTSYDSEDIIKTKKKTKEDELKEERLLLKYVQNHDNLYIYIIIGK